MRAYQAARLHIGLCTKYPLSNISYAPSLVIGVEGVEKQLLSLNSNKAPGPDGIFSWMLKMVAEELAPILTELYQQSINEGYVPNQWRQADVCLLFKKGDRAKPSITEQCL